MSDKETTHFVYKDAAKDANAGMVSDYELVILDELDMGREAANPCQMRRNACLFSFDTSAGRGAPVLRKRLQYAGAYSIPSRRPAE